MPSVPPTNQITSREQYREWLDSLAENEMENYLHDVGDDELEVQDLYTYIYEAPIFDGGNDVDWSLFMFDVRRYADVDIPRETIVIPDNDPFAATAIVTQGAVKEDLACRVQEMLESEGYEVA